MPDVIALTVTKEKDVTCALKCSKEMVVRNAHKATMGTTAVSHETWRELLTFQRRHKIPIQVLQWSSMRISF